jgi:hypothetical protein
MKNTFIGFAVSILATSKKDEKATYLKEEAELQPHCSS